VDKGVSKSGAERFLSRSEDAPGREGLHGDMGPLLSPRRGLNLGFIPWWESNLNPDNARI
jgi:hypothetical protein